MLGNRRTTFFQVPGHQARLAVCSIPPLARSRCRKECRLSTKEKLRSDYYHKMTLIQDQPSAGSAMKPPTSEPGQGRRLFKMLGLRYKFS